MKTIVKSPQLKIQSGQDGVWLHFRTSKGDAASLNLHVLFGVEGRIRDKAICEWAKEYAQANPTSKDVKRGDIKRFRDFLNAQDDGEHNHRHGRYQQRTRKYGDYLYAQDREKFMVDMAEWLKTNSSE